jgi:hypothetical protein
MKVKHNAMEQIDKVLEERAGGTTAQQEWMERRDHLLRDQLSTEKGREFFWEFVANSRALGMEPYTGSADTYMRLGYQRWPKELLKSAKTISFTSYQKMEAEARVREDARKKAEEK